MVSVVGVVTAVTSAITGTVVVVLSVLLLHEIIVRLKRDMKIMDMRFFIIFFFRNYNFWKSHTIIRISKINTSNFTNIQY